MTTKSTTKSGTKSTGMTKTTTTRKTAAKSSLKTAAKSNVKSIKKGPALSVVTATQTTSVTSEMKKRELIDMVVERSGVKKKFAKPAVEAMLDVLGQALSEERALNLQPLGRVVPKRTKEAGSNRVITARIRQSKERLEKAAADAEMVKKDPVAKPVD